VALAFRLLCVLIFVRVLCPPGVCLCKLSGMPARLAAAAAGDEQLPPPEEDDDHDSGCPASPLSAAMGLKPAHVPQHAVAFVAESLDLPDAAQALSPLDDLPPLPVAWPPDPHLYLTHCSFQI
jgi:hypothetical protein